MTSSAPQNYSSTTLPSNKYIVKVQKKIKETKLQEKRRPQENRLTQEVNKNSYGHNERVATLSQLISNT